jgi:hypothetical protein
MRSSRLSRSNYRNKYILFWYLDDEKCEFDGGEQLIQTIEETALRAS